MVGMQTRQDSTDRHRAPITLVLVDDERIIRGALTQSLTSAGFDIVAEAANAQDAVRLVVDLRPDVVLMDLRLPDRAGVETVEQITLLAPASRPDPHPHRGKPGGRGDRRWGKRLHPQDCDAGRDHRRRKGNRRRRIGNLLPDRREAPATHP